MAAILKRVSRIGGLAAAATFAFAINVAEAGPGPGPGTGPGGKGPGLPAPGPLVGSGLPALVLIGGGAYFLFRRTRKAQG